MKKPNKENPLITFRKANESRKAVVIKSLKKAQDGGESPKDRWGRLKSDKWYGFNPKSKKYESVYSPNLEKKHGSKFRYNEVERIDSSPNKTYLADKKGNVGSYTYYPSGDMSGVSIDTTGYSKGKQTFPKTIDVSGSSSTYNIPRKQAIKEVKKMKTAALNERQKKGGIIKTKKK